MHPKTTLRSSALVMALAWAAGASAAPPLTRQAIEAKACSRSTEQSLARAARATAAAERANAGVAPNPRIEAQHLRTLDGPKDRETVVGLSVPFVVSGRRGVLADAARARGREADAGVRARRFEVLVEARRLFARAVLAKAKADVLARQQQALDALVRAMAELARGGEAARYDTLRQSLEVRAHRQTLVRASAEAAAAKEALESWLGEDVTLPDLERSGVLAADTKALGENEHPSLQSLRASAQASELEARAARRLAVPDPEVFAGYRQVDVEGATGRGIALGLTVPLPLFDHGQGEAARADAAAARARAELAFERRRNETAKRAELRRLAALRPEVDRAAASAREAEELREGARKLYAAGELSVVELLDAYRAAEAADLARLEVLEDVALSRVELARARGDACGGQR